jgi:opacity protein-like surface antigen
MFRKFAAVALLAMPALASAQPYFIGGVAEVSADIDFAEQAYNPGYTTEYDDSRVVLGVGIRSSDNLSVELLYMSKSESSVTGSVTDTVICGCTYPDVVTSFEHQGIQAGILAFAPLHPQFSLYGKLTLTAVIGDLEISQYGLVGQEESASDIYFGLGGGAQFQINDQVGVRFGVERIMVREFADYTDTDVDVDQATAALLFSF